VVPEELSGERGLVTHVTEGVHPLGEQRAVPVHEGKETAAAEQVED
jgi:hypothetical protein